VFGVRGVCVGLAFAFDDAGGLKVHPVRQDAVGLAVGHPGVADHVSQDALFSGLERGIAGLGLAARGGHGSGRGAGAGEASASGSSQHGAQFGRGRSGAHRSAPVAVPVVSTVVVRVNSAQTRVPNP